MGVALGGAVALVLGKWKNSTSDAPCLNGAGRGLRRRRADRRPGEDSDGKQARPIRDSISLPRLDDFGRPNDVVHAQQADIGVDHSLL